jgi:integrase/recombinase XerD
MTRSDKIRFLTNEVSKGPPGLPALVHDYVEEVEIRGKAEATAKHYGAYLDTFVEWLGFNVHKDRAALAIADIDSERLRAYQLFLARRRDRRTGRPIGPATRNVYTTALREFLKYVRHRRGFEAPDPTEALPRAKERDVEIRRLGRDEFERLRAAIDLTKPGGLRDRAILEALFGSGARLSEVASLTVRGVDLRRREIQVIGKGSKSRLVLLTLEAAGWIERYLATRRDECPALFVTIKGRTVRPLGARQIERIVERAAARAGLPFKVSPHWLRHSRLTIVARHSGVEVAQRVAGHASLQTTARYLHVTDQQLRALYDQAEAADREPGPA